jgi:hypothetical protein
MNTNLEPKENGVDTVTLSVVELDRLLNDSMFLGCLEAVGVDGWDGYDVAVEMMEGE